MMEGRARSNPKKPVYCYQRLFEPDECWVVRDENGNEVEHSNFAAANAQFSALTMSWVEGDTRLVE